MEQTHKECTQGIKEGVKKSWAGAHLCPEGVTQPARHLSPISSLKIGFK